jgi:hypothetical protein
MRCDAIEYGLLLFMIRQQVILGMDFATSS